MDRDARARLIRSSCLGSGGLPSLPDQSVDHFLFDPPFSAHVHAHARRGGSSDGKQAVSSAVDLGFSALSARTRTLVARQIARLCRRWAFVFSDIETCHLWRQAGEAAGMEYVRTGKWRKVGGMPQFTGDRPAVWGEVFTILHPPGKKRWAGGGKAGDYPVYPVYPEGQAVDVEYSAQPVHAGRLHTTEKPVALLEAILRDFTEPGDLVCDPFAGSAATGVAAVHLGRRFLGYERDRAFYRAAYKRLGLAREQLLLFPEAQTARDDLTTTADATAKGDTNGL